MPTGGAWSHDGNDSVSFMLESDKVPIDAFCSSKAMADSTQSYKNFGAPILHLFGFGSIGIIGINV